MNKTESSKQELVVLTTISQRTKLKVVKETERSSMSVTMTKSGAGKV